MKLKILYFESILRVWVDEVIIFPDDKGHAVLHFFDFCDGLPDNSIILKQDNIESISVEEETYITKDEISDKDKQLDKKLKDLLGDKYTPLNFEDHD